MAATGIQCVRINLSNSVVMRLSITLPVSHPPYDAISVMYFLSIFMLGYVPSTINSIMVINAMFTIVVVIMASSPYPLIAIIIPIADDIM